MKVIVKTAGLTKLLTAIIVTMSLIWSPAPANGAAFTPLISAAIKRARVIWTPAKKFGSATRYSFKTNSLSKAVGYEELVWRHGEQLQFERARPGLSEEERTIQLDPIVGPEVRRKKNTYSLLDDELERTIHSESSSSSWTMQMAKSPEDILLQKQRKALFDRCIERVLSKSLFETFSLKYDENLSYKSISSQLGIRAGTVASRLSEARGKVRSRCGGIL